MTVLDEALEENGPSGGQHDTLGDHHMLAACAHITPESTHTPPRYPANLEFWVVIASHQYDGRNASDLMDPNTCASPLSHLSLATDGQMHVGLDSSLAKARREGVRPT